ncbi:S-layer homology domain-containing protein [Ammoniphilus sp. YIM 78166]|uniref:S-layer homology domain-containing protein n=1 Tax=Ammoniphilus sp. YIM 78166 TaxID=1644106 RepID=UPI0014308287|nr:S-layer homology domain-containing protein [Ammoniphilus sp. YIM 78166]
MNKHTVKGFILGMVATVSVGAGLGMAAADTFKNYFTDVAKEKWYAENVEWAKDMGLMNGTGNDKFSPEKALTRAEMATVLRNLYDKGFFVEQEAPQAPVTETPAAETPATTETPAQTETPAATTEAPATETPAAEATETPATTPAAAPTDNTQPNQ